MALKMLQRKPVEPHEDYGFFGPGLRRPGRSGATPPRSTVGFQRSVVIEELDPRARRRRRRRPTPCATAPARATTARSDTSPWWRSAPPGRRRRRRTCSSRCTRRPSASSRSAATATTPTIPHSQLWIHLTAWHSILYTYEKFGPGPLIARGRGPLLGGVRDRRRAPDLRPGRRPAHTRGHQRVFRDDAPAAWPGRRRPS